MVKEDAVIFIDEPELNLHPGMQRLFLEQITRNKVLTKKNITYVIATHSNHLLDLTLQHDSVSIYSFNSKSDEKFEIRNVNLGDNTLLRNLGVNNSSVFLANKTIWVEGISDRNYLKAFLYAFSRDKKKAFPKEDIDFAFFEYAGSNLVHYEFKDDGSDEVLRSISAMALSNKIFLLADSDGVNKSDTTVKAKRLRELELSENQNIKFYCDKEYREVENLLPNDVWRKVLIDSCNDSKLKKEGVKEQSLKEINEGLDEYDSNDFKLEYIGEFLSKLDITNLNKVYKINNEGVNGTFDDKTNLSKLVLQKTISGELTWDDFKESPGIVKLTEELNSFLDS